jgi:plastocyanin
MHLPTALRIPALAFGASAALLIGVACGGGGENETIPTPPASANVPEGAPFVDQKNLAFIPTRLTTTAGTTIYFLNSETALHTITINGVNESGNMRRNDLFTWAPPSPGEYKITCDYHPQMRATITVE